MIIIRNSIRCKKCGDHIESRHRYDLVTCSCKSVSVDGGKYYIRRLGNEEDYEETSIVIRDRG